MPWGQVNNMQKAKVSYNPNVEDRVAKGDLKCFGGCS